MISWRTTALGICSILAAIAAAGKALLDTDPTTNPDWGLLVAAITAGVGLIVARDNRVTSEQAGAK
jgi:hypothetical protein